MKAESIKTPEGVTELMREMWLRHEAGIPQRKNNVFFVELPPPTEEELAAAREEENDNVNKGD